MCSAGTSAGLPRTALLVLDGLGLSGKTRTMAFIATHLDPTRFRAEVCTFNADPSALTDQLRAAGIPVHVLRCRDGMDASVVVRLARLIRSLRCEIVHAYNPRPILYGGIAAIACGVRARIGTLSAFACQVPDRTYDFLPQALSTRSRKNIIRNRIAARSMRYLTTVSESLGARFCAYNGIPFSKMRVVPYGADLNAVDSIDDVTILRMRAELGLADGDVVIGSVGRLIEQKDYPTQLRAFALACARVPQMTMVIAGDGPLAGPLREMARSLGIATRVRFLGHWSEVPALLRSLDIFVLASKFEPFGVSLLEAKAAGVAIIATNVNETPEIVFDGRTGLLCQPQDPEAMADLFVRLAEDPSLRLALGAEARRDAQEHHSLVTVVDAYQELYESCFDQ
jgi:glycosyltransferase involved in cell wall biosynthesis